MRPNIDRYLELDGYKAVQKALAMEPDAIINEVKNSGLRGRGGAGFSTGMKWSFVPKQSAKPKYVLCNGDESEPGTCKDRLIFEHDPHAVIEGVMIAALAVGSQTGYIYIRGEYRYLSVIMQKAIKDAYARECRCTCSLRSHGQRRDHHAFDHMGTSTGPCTCRARPFAGRIPAWATASVQTTTSFPSRNPRPRPRSPETLTSLMIASGSIASA